MKLLPKIATAAALCGMSLSAFAGAGAPEAGSLLLFPCFDSNRGSDTVITVTNTNADFTQVGLQLLAGTVDVEFVYINKYDCQEFNRTRRLTPNDTLSVLARLDNPNQREGYVYVFAKSPLTGAAISWNWLIGISQVDSAVGNAVDINPYVFKAIGAQGAETDVNADGERNLDGVEYEGSPEKIQIPRFIAQGPAESVLVLINLTGAARFRAVVDFLVYNDNEEVFSAQYDFECWKKKELREISGVFEQGFLATTNHNPLESILTAETGWMRLDGRLAYSSADSVNNPAILAALFERFNGGVTGELPFTMGTQTNGELVSQSVFHD